MQHDSWPKRMCSFGLYNAFRGGIGGLQRSNNRVGAIDAKLMWEIEYLCRRLLTTIFKNDAFHIIMGFDICSILSSHTIGKLSLDI